MSDLETPSIDSEPDPARNPSESNPSQSPNLTLIYGLIAVALIAAIGFAILIVLPFYHRR
jgi:hypothetical protein